MSHSEQEFPPANKQTHTQSSFYNMIATKKLRRGFLPTISIRHSILDDLNNLSTTFNKIYKYMKIIMLIHVHKELEK